MLHGACCRVVHTLPIPCPLQPERCCPQGGYLGGYLLRGQPAFNGWVLSMMKHNSLFNLLIALNLPSPFRLFRRMKAACSVCVFRAGRLGTAAHAAALALLFFTRGVAWCFSEIGQGAPPSPPPPFAPNVLAYIQWASCLHKMPAGCGTYCLATGNG